MKLCLLESVRGNHIRSEVKRFMHSSSLLRRFVPCLAAAIAVAGFSPGCSRLLPPRKGVASSYEVVIDSRRDPSPALSGCFIPATFPAITKLPIVFVQKIPPGAKFLSVTQQVVLTNGDAPCVLEPVIENNQVYLKFAVPKMTSFTQWHVILFVKYEYR